MDTITMLNTLDELNDGLTALYIKYKQARNSASLDELQDMTNDIVILSHHITVIEERLSHTINKHQLIDDFLQKYSNSSNHIVH